MLRTLATFLAGTIFGTFGLTGAQAAEQVAPCQLVAGGECVPVEAEPVDACTPLRNQLQDAEVRLDRAWADVKTYGVMAADLQRNNRGLTAEAERLEERLERKNTTIKRLRAQLR